MPEAVERKLRAEAAKRGLTGKEADSFIYGTMNNMGLMKGSKETKKGKESDRKHKE